MHHDGPAPRRRRLIAHDDRADELGPEAAPNRSSVPLRKIVMLVAVLAALVAALSTSTLCAAGRSCDVERPIRVLLGDDAGTNP